MLEREDEEGGLFTAVEIAPRGPAVVRRRFAGAGFGAEAVRVGGRARIAIGRGDALARLFELDPSVSEGFEEVEWPVLQPGLAVCADPPSASADLRWTPGVRIADVGPFQSVALVEARDGRSCVRAVHARGGRRAAGDRASLWARRGVLEGWAATGYRRLTRVRCTEAR